MPLGFATLPLGPAELRALADADYSIIDQAVRTPGLLIIQSPDQATGDGGAPTAVGRATEEGAGPEPGPVGPDEAPDARRPSPVA